MKHGRSGRGASRMRLLLWSLLLYLTATAIDGAPPQGVTSMAMQQGGLGLLMTLLLISVPPMAAAFLQGTLGHFTPYSAFNQQSMQQTRPGQAGGGYHPAGASSAPAGVGTPGATPTHSHRGVG